MDIKLLEKLNLDCEEWKDILTVDAQVYRVDKDYSLGVTFGILSGGRVVQHFMMTFTPRSASESEMRIPELPESFIEEFGEITALKVQDAMNHVKLAILNRFFPKMKISSTVH